MKVLIPAVLLAASLSTGTAEAGNGYFWNKLFETNDCGSGSMCTNKGYICVIK